MILLCSVCIDFALVFNPITLKHLLFFDSEMAHDVFRALWCMSVVYVMWCMSCVGAQDWCTFYHVALVHDYCSACHVSEHRTGALSTTWP